MKAIEQMKERVKEEMRGYQAELAETRCSATRRELLSLILHCTKQLEAWA